MLSIVLAAIAIFADPSRAEAFAERGVAAFKAKQYAEAADYFLRAYELSGESTALRNAARAYEEAGQKDAALRRWREYRALPDIEAEERREAEMHIAALRPPIKTAPPIPTAPPIVTAPPIASSSPPAVAYGLGGVGIAAAIAGAITFAVGQSTLSSLEDRLAVVDNDGRISGIDRATALAEQSRSDSLRTTGAVLITSGATIIVASVIWLILDGDRE